ncbi:MAG: hypothetical protein WKF62_03605 [Solirubrobacterales bacterium]
MSGNANGLRMSRRRMVVASGAAIGAPLILAACGSAEEERSEGNDPDLLNAVLAQHLAVLEAAEAIDSIADPGPAVSSALITARTDSITQLEAFVGERDGTATTGAADLAQAESPAEGLALQLEASIEASLDTIGDLSAAAYRQSVHRFITEDAAALAALRTVTGGEIAPDAFVFGPPTSSEGS